MQKQISILLALAVALVGLAAGCGGSSDAAISKSEFIAKADAICERADKTQAGEAIAYQKAHSKEFVNLPGEVVIEKLVPVVLLPSIQQQAEQIEALGSPSGDEEKIEKIISGIEEAIKKAEKNPRSVEIPRGSGGPFRGVGKLAREYGFKDCDEIT